MSRAAKGDVRRLFVAVDPPPEAVEHLGAVVDTLGVSRANAPGRSTRMAARDRWHLTLAFLGEVPAGRVDDAAVAVARAAAGGGSSTAAERGPIAIRFAGGGRFGRGRFTVLWAGVDGDVPALRALAREIRSELKLGKLPFDDKPFRPHLTISRVGDRVGPDVIAEDVKTLAAYVGPLWTADAVHLVTSTLGPHPQHMKVSSSPLSRD
jgi:RNA 2',3'-cyclic 3'-phosphodiesterase